MEVPLVERAVYILDMNVERRSGSTLRLCDCIVLGGAAPSPTDRTSRVEYDEDADCRRNILNAVTTYCACKLRRPSLVYGSPIGATT